MKKNDFVVTGKFVIAVWSVAAVLFALPVQAGEKTSPQWNVKQEIRKTLQKRVELLERLTADCEKQYKNGSLDGNMVLQARTDLYAAKLLLMKAEAGLPPEAGVACAAIRLAAAETAGAEMQKRFSGGNLSLFLFLNTLLKANTARLDYLKLLRGCGTPEAMEKVFRELPPFNPERRLDDEWLRELLNAEIQAK
ncbi:MAG: hypothetical protein J5858_01970 [Lentisphaeria bacterium]|nr:hypothetical protein [Lentisphaeria bacterium]